MLTSVSPLFIPTMFLADITAANAAGYAATAGAAAGCGVTNALNSVGKIEIALRKLESPRSAAGRTRRNLTESK